MNLLGVQAQPRSQQAYTLAEVVITAFAFGIMAISLFSGFSSGYALMQLQRENLRATQIMVQKMETIRLLNWAETNDTNGYVRVSFSDWFNPYGTNSSSTGAHYVGVITTNAVSGIYAATTGAANNDYATSMRAFTVTIYWTNYPVWPQTNAIVRTRT